MTRFKLIIIIMQENFGGKEKLRQVLNIQGMKDTWHCKKEDGTFRKLRIVI